MPRSSVSPAAAAADRRPAVAPAVSPAARLLVWVIRGYQLALSPMFAGCCRFVPSCSAYAAEAVMVHGAIRGSWLTVARLVRCQPFCRGGLDPVPTRRDRLRAEVASTPRR